MKTAKEVPIIFCKGVKTGLRKQIGVKKGGRNT